MTWLIVIGVFVLTFLATRSAYVGNILTRALLALSIGWIALYLYSTPAGHDPQLVSLLGPPAVLWVAVILLRWIFAPPQPRLSWPQPAHEEHRIRDVTPE